MKKSLVVLIAALVIGLMAMSCSTYTCPTYSKAVPERRSEVKI